VTPGAMIQLGKANGAARAELARVRDAVEAKLPASGEWADVAVMVNQVWEGGARGGVSRTPSLGATQRCCSSPWRCAHALSAPCARRLSARSPAARQSRP